MKIVLLLLGLFLGFWGFMVVIQGALGVGLMVCGAVFVSAGCLGYWLDQSREEAAKKSDEVRALLAEIRDQGKRPAPEPVPAEFDAAKAVEAMEAARKPIRRFDLND